MNPELNINRESSDLVLPSSMTFLPEGLRPELLKYCLKLTRSRWDAEDLTQETLLKSFTQFAAHTNPKAYLFRIAKNAWIDKCRKLKEEVELTEHCYGSNDRDLVQLTEALSVLSKKLSPLQCVIFLLREVWLFSAQEVAQLIGTTEGAVKSALHRARRNLKSFKNRDMDEEHTNGGAETELQKIVLQTLVNSFLTEDLEALLVLVQNDVIHPVQALSSLWEAEVQQKDQIHKNGHAQVQAMAA